MTYYIYGRIANRRVWFVGCSRTADIPPDSIILETVEHRPEVHWVKWSIRFRRTLTEKKALDHSFAKYFKNSSRTKRLYGDTDYTQFAAEQNAKFLQFHRKNPHLFELLLNASLEKAEERNEYSVDQLLGEVRWSDTEIDRGDDKVKVNGTWSAWYSRALQMVESRLIGFFAVRSSTADALVWTDDRSWEQFASEHEDEIQWNEPFDELPDSDWEYQG